MLKDKQLLHKIFTVSRTKGKTSKKKAKWQNGQRICTNWESGEKEIQRTQMYEKMFNITQSNK